jgi:very-short-patch-repair endonuclease
MNKQVNDNQRDRLFQLNGYRVIRYSGSGIYNNPVEVSSNLFDLINTLDNNTENRRIT